jgi:hypothetical protein
MIRNRYDKSCCSSRYGHSITTIITVIVVAHAIVTTALIIASIAVVTAIVDIIVAAHTRVAAIIAEIGAAIIGVIVGCTVIGRTVVGRRIVKGHSTSPQQTEARFTAQALLAEPCRIAPRSKRRRMWPLFACRPPCAGAWAFSLNYTIFL